MKRALEYWEQQQFPGPVKRCRVCIREELNLWLEKEGYRECDDRRGIHITKVLAVSEEEWKAIKMCTSRYTETKLGNCSKIFGKCSEEAGSEPCEDFAL
jgi:hypothetical protein